ncbi:heavy metal-associated isoprenylated plant protein 20-like [Cucumis melo var. makuwa]|uniref:Heavy metal-associated isoprenylated plant protein 20-like n=2 Tax=Cucumis melo TaxID=3656 RepID=A0A5D3BSZ1_CUCMM|nr:heavy metal-associated isoprenylated plant protein 20-like [Cucumis melo var. makuwa]
MGVEHYLICISHKHYKKQLQLQTVELKVAMDCDGCELKVKKALSSLRGVKSVKINRKQLKVTVIGYVEASKVLKKAKSTGKKAEIWPYVPYNLVAHPYIPPFYDKKAPPGYVRNANNAPVEDNNNASFLKFDDPSNFVSIFSDDNPNAACSIM